MKIPILQGVIKRRILVNYNAEPEVISKILPKSFRPKLHKGKAVAGICLIGLENIRPKSLPEAFGFSSENAAHRIAVTWKNEDGQIQEGVYIPRRDTNSNINSLVGGTLFPGEHHKAFFSIEESGTVIDFAMSSKDEKVKVKLKGKVAETLPENSIFKSLVEVSKFFEKGSLGYSVKSNSDSLDGLVLHIENWEIKPLDLDFVESSFYDNENLFPKGSIQFDNALLMQNIKHEWHSAPDL